LRELAAIEIGARLRDQAVAGRQAGQGRRAAGAKVTAEIARIRGIPQGVDSISPNRHPEVSNVDQLLDRIALIRDVTGKPVGIKTALGGWHFMNDLCEAVLRRGIASAPISSRSMAARAVRGGAAGTGRPRGAVDRRGAAARGRCPDRSGTCASG
jgi:hypothetical protein